MKLYELKEDAWQDDYVDDAINKPTPNPMPVAPDSESAPVFDAGDDIVNRRVALLRTIKIYANLPYPKLVKMARNVLGKMRDVPISQTISIEPYLDGTHLRALVDNEPTHNPSNIITLIKSGKKYYIQDGNHRVAAAFLRGEKHITALVLDVGDF